MSTTDTLRTEALGLLDERDMRFYDERLINLVRSNLTAGEVTRLSQREPLLDELGARVITAAARYSIPAMDDRALTYFIHCARFCPKR